eukprot:scaffold145_cov86-Skeletonema_menzelii.AAC.1
MSTFQDGSSRSTSVHQLRTAHTRKKKTAHTAPLCQARSISAYLSNLATLAHHLNIRPMLIVVIDAKYLGRASIVSVTALSEMADYIISRSQWVVSIHANWFT